MKFVKSILTGTGAVVLAGLILALLAPKAVHAVAATFVQVTNTAANPVVVQDVDSAGRQPFAVTSEASQLPTVVLPALTSGGGAVQTVVIEFVSAQCRSVSGVNTIGVPTLLTSLGAQLPNSDRYFLPAVFQGDFIDGSYFAIAQPVTIYANPGSTVTFETTAANSGCSLTLSGHLVQ
jgi:hypothetical protein